MMTAIQEDVSLQNSMLKVERDIDANTKKGSVFYVIVDGIKIYMPYQHCLVLNRLRSRIGQFISDDELMSHANYASENVWKVVVHRMNVQLRQTRFVIVRARKMGAVLVLRAEA